MRAAIYARVSTSDRDQDPETQLLPLREFVDAQNDQVAGVWVDRAPAGDLGRRAAWLELLGKASRRQVDLVLVWRLDRAFRSVLDAASTLERLRGWGVGLRSYSEPWLDTTSPFGEALFHITAAYAQLERAVLSERVRAGMARARSHGKAVGRPAVGGRQQFQVRWPRVAAELRAGSLTTTAAARQLGVSRATVRR